MFGTGELCWSTRMALRRNDDAGCSRRLDCSPANPQCAEVRLVSSKTAVSQDQRRHGWGFARVLVVRDCAGEIFQDSVRKYG